MKIGFIGGGNMAEAMIHGMTSRGIRNILVSEPVEERRRYLRDHFGVDTAESNSDVVSACTIIILAVKPQIMQTVLEEVGPSVSEDKTVVSIAAGIPLAFLSSRLKTKKLVRVMPNTPSLVQEGMAVMSHSGYLADSDVSRVREIFTSFGKLLTLPEEYMDAVTALSGSGPAFIAFFVEAMIAGGVKVGLNKDDAFILAMQTAIGTSRLLASGMSPSKVRELVTSPGGTTEAGLRILREKGLADTVEAAIEAAATRAKELSG